MIPLDVQVEAPPVDTDSAISTKNNKPAAAPAPVVEHKDVIVPPKSNPKRPVTQPEYPPSSKRLGEQGTVVMLLTVNEEGKVVEVRVGSVIAPDAFAAIAEDRDATEYLRWRTYLLARRTKPDTSWPAVLRSKIATTIATRITTKMQEPLAAPANPEILQQEIEQLPSDRCLAQNSEFAVYHGTARELPHGAGTSLRPAYHAACRA